LIKKINIEGEKNDNIWYTWITKSKCYRLNWF
jgi:hypothetical protein